MKLPFLLNCKQATFLADRFHSNDLGSFQRLRVLLHLNICKSCSNYYKQSLLLNRELKSYLQQLESIKAINWNEQQKQELYDKLINELNSSNKAD